MPKNPYFTVIEVGRLISKSISGTADDSSSSLSHISTEVFRETNNNISIAVGVALTLPLITSNEIFFAKNHIVISLAAAYHCYPILISVHMEATIISSYKNLTEIFPMRG